MEDDKSDLEERAKEFYKLRIEVDPSNRGFNPIDIKEESLPECVPLINYLVKNNYLVEGSYIPEEQIPSAGSLRYKRTFLGDDWAEIK